MKIKFLVIFCIIIFVSKSSLADEQKTDISIYTGTFDIIDKEGDDQTSLIGLEHRNSDLFRNTVLGKLTPLRVMTKTKWLEYKQIFKEVNLFELLNIKIN